MATKSIGDLEFTVGVGFGRLAGKDPFTNPLAQFSSHFETRDTGGVGRGGTLGSINWFQGDASAFYGVSYQLADKLVLSSEFNPDNMPNESRYLDIKSHWNFGASYQANSYLNIGAQYLHGSQFSLTAHVAVNPNRPPLAGGMELAPVPMRLRGGDALPILKNDETTIRKVLAADRFQIHRFEIKLDTVTIVVTNTKFRSIAQAVGRVASTLQRFTSDEVKFANISFQNGNLKAASYLVDLETITLEQYNPKITYNGNPSIIVIDQANQPHTESRDRFSWGIGPYVAHRLFNPDLPLSLETGIQLESAFELAPNLKLSGSIRKSLLTNLTENQRRSNSSLPRVHSDWPLYDLAGQSGHIHALAFSYTRNFGSKFYGRLHSGLLEPFFAGFGGELLFKPAQSPFAIGLDVHHVQKRDYDMRFDLLDYSATVGHLSFYYDAGNLFNIEVNAGRYLAGDWGLTTTISRKFGSGWEVGGYATFTDVPFETFGEGSFDKAIFVSMPIDWLVSSPNQTRRHLTLRPITRDGGAQLASARRLYRTIERSQNADFKREFGRLWK